MMLTMGTPAGAGALWLTPDMPAGDPAVQASLAPGVGEAMDVAVILDPESSPGMVLAATVSLLIGLVLPEAPNFGAARGRDEPRKLSDAPERMPFRRYLGFLGTLARAE